MRVRTLLQSWDEHRQHLPTKDTTDVCGEACCGTTAAALVVSQMPVTITKYQ